MGENESPAAGVPEVTKRVDGHMKWLREFAISLAISVFIIVFLYQPVKVEGTSMMPGLAD